MIESSFSTEISSVFKDRKKYREENTLETTHLNDLYFEGKKDNTLQINGTKEIEQNT